MEKNKTIIIIVISIIVAAAMIVAGFYYGHYGESNAEVDNAAEKSQFFILFYGITTDGLNSSFFDEFLFEDVNETTFDWMRSLKGYSILIGVNNTEGISSAFTGPDDGSLRKDCKLYLVNTTEVNKYGLHLNDPAFIKGHIIETRNFAQGTEVCLVKDPELI